MYTLRPYQNECIETVKNLPDGSRSVVCLATGLGKSLIGAHLPHDGRVLWLSHRDELVRQPQKYFDEQGISYGIEKADEFSHGEEVVSASIQTLSKTSRLHTFQPDAFDLIICDEAHHAAADTYKKVLRYFHPRKLIGLTATPRRGDHKGLNDVFDSICFVRDLRWGIENGYLSRIRNLRVSADLDLDKINMYMGDYSQSALGEAIEDSDVDIVVRDAYFTHCYPEQKKTLVFCPTVSSCEKVAETLRNSLPDDEKSTVAVLHSGLSNDERHSILSGYRDGSIRCIVNCMILTEGSDLPDTSAIINARPTANDTLYQQIIGRGTRIADGKEYCLIIDVIGKGSRARYLCSALALFGINTQELPDNVLKSLDGTKDLAEIADSLNKGIIEAKNFIDAINFRYEMYDLFANEKETLASSKLSPEEKAKAYEDKYIVPGEEIFKGLCVRHTASDNRYYQINATYRDRIYLSKPDLIDKTVMTFECPDIGYQFVKEDISMEDAVNFIRDYLRYVVPPVYATQWSEDKRAEWSKTPATPSQQSKISYVYKGTRYSDVKKLSKLSASDLIQLQVEIDNVKGEMKRYEGIIQASQKKGKKAQQKWMTMRDELIEKQKNDEKVLRDNADHQMEEIRDKVEKGKAAEEEKKRLIEKADQQERKSPEMEMTMDVTNDWYTFAKATNNQVDYCMSLESRLESIAVLKGADSVRDDVEQLTRWQMGYMIDYLKYAIAYVNLPHKNRIEFDYKEAYQKISNMDSNDIGKKITFNLKFLIPEDE